MIERTLTWKLVQRRRHPPGKPLRLPDPAEAHIRVLIEPLCAARLIEALECTREDEDVGCGQVEAFRTGWRHDMSGIAREKEPAVTHGRRHEAAHRRHTFLENATDVRPPTVSCGHAPKHFLPDGLVGPVLDALLGRD